MLNNKDTKSVPIYNEYTVILNNQALKIPLDSSYRLYFYKKPSLIFPFIVLLILLNASGSSWAAPASEAEQYEIYITKERQIACKSQREHRHVVH